MELLVASPSCHAIPLCDIFPLLHVEPTAEVRAPVGRSPRWQLHLYPPRSRRQPFRRLGRIVGVLFSPKATFEDIVRKPSWLLPFVIMFVLALLGAISLNQRINWRDYVSQQVEKSPRAAQLSAEQKEQQIEAGAKFAPISTYIFVPIGPIVMLLVVTLVMWGSYNLLGGANTDFKTSLGIVSHAFVPSYISQPVVPDDHLLKPVAGRSHCSILWPPMWPRFCRMGYRSGWTLLQERGRFCDMVCCC